MFITKLKTEHVKGDVWKLTAPLKYMHNGTLITVPEGFHTDFASIKGTLITIFGRPSGTSVEPAVVHDFLYSKLSNHYSYSREGSDKCFLDAMTCVEVSWFRRHGMYHGVRIFGFAFYKK